MTEVAQSKNFGDGKKRVPFVFLITDGAVKNEKDICLYARSLSSSIRLASHFYLIFASLFPFQKKKKKIQYFWHRSRCEPCFPSNASPNWKGFFRSCLDKKRSLQVEQFVFLSFYWPFLSTVHVRRMVYLLRTTRAPVLTEVRIGIAKTAENVEIYPYPIPDLFSGAPIIFSGKYSGTFPETIAISGLFADQSKFKTEVSVNSNSPIPIERIFVKQQLDLLSSQVSPPSPSHPFPLAFLYKITNNYIKAWLTDSRKIKKNVIDISCRESMPCELTTMVAYEVKPGEKSKFDKKKLLDKRVLSPYFLSLPPSLTHINLAPCLNGNIYIFLSYCKSTEGESCWLLEEFLSSECLPMLLVTYQLPCPMFRLETYQKGSGNLFLLSFLFFF